ncbi:hypothetical protein ACYSNR_06895 [Enterococcus sp. LJL128]
MAQTEENIAQQLTIVTQTQADIRKKQWRLEELEQDYRRLATRQETFLLDVLYSHTEQTQQFFSELEDDLFQSHRANLLTIETDIYSVTFLF